MRSRIVLNNYFAAIVVMGVMLIFTRVCPAENVFAGAAWEKRDPAALGIDSIALDRVAEDIGGRGCIVKDGYVAKAWGDQAEVRDWASSAKPAKRMRSTPTPRQVSR